MTLALAEKILHSLVNYVPYVIFILLVFDTKYRHSKEFLFFIVSFSSGIQAILLFTPYFREDASSQLLSFSLTLISLIFYIMLVELNFFQALFRLLIVNNVANFVAVAAKCLEGLLFPSLACELSRWSYSLCMLIVQVVVLIPLAFVLNKWYPKKEDASEIDPKVWRVLCVMPSTFFIIWYYVFYYSSDVPSLQMALNPMHTLFQFFILCGQITIYCCTLNLVATYSKLILLKEENNRLSIQALQYQNIQKQIQEVRAAKHDMRHHLMLMSSYADNDKYDELKVYLHRYMEQLHISNTISYCNNLPLNMVLVYYSQLCREQDISMDIKLNIPDDLILSNNEIAVLFGNLLENAYDACASQAAGAKQLSLHGLCRQQQVIFTIDNTFDNKIIMDSAKRFRSTKHDGCGFGTASARNIVSKYHGHIEFGVHDHLFCVSIMLPQFPAPSNV